MKKFDSNNHIKAKTPLALVKAYDKISLALRLFSKRKKLTTNHNFTDPFFIIGSGRSGNTLLRSMLVSGKQVSIPPESYVWPRVIRIFSTYNFLPWEKLCSLIIGEFEAYNEFYTWEVNLYNTHQKARELKKENQTLSNILNIVYQTFIIEKKESVKRWGDKTPINTLFIDKVYKVFPKAQYVHIIREPKDVACSYVKAGIYSSYLESAKNWKLYAEKALWLERKVSKQQFYKVHYEDLVEQPKIELKKITAFLGITYNPEMLEFWKNTKSLGDVQYLKHHKNIATPVSTKSVGKWKETLTKEEAEYIDKVTKSTFEKIKK